MLVSQAGATEVTLRNNIFYNLGSGRYTKKSSWTYDHNMFLGNNVPTTSVIPDKNMMTLDPLFVYPGIGDKGLGTLDGYKLQVDSPAIGRGTLISNSGSQDFWGNLLSPISQNRGAYGGQAVSITVIRDLLDYYLKTGDVKNPLYKQLSNKLEQAEQFKSKGQEKKAVKHMEDFITHLIKILWENSCLSKARDY
ncbi:FIMAH domain-containing protein [Bacillus sp. FSL K6-3431]|uniref:FIMAH domain-containing protein n=1 Tax=Bacillus sp. FSL K6-3431 TaxID=2921500 RepID=UPI0030F86934